MVIQKLLFPREEVCNEWEMFFHSRNVKRDYPIRLNRRIFNESDGVKMQGRNIPMTLAITPVQL